MYYAFIKIYKINWSLSLLPKWKVYCICVNLQWLWDSCQYVVKRAILYQYRGASLINKEIMHNLELPLSVETYLWLFDVLYALYIINRAQCTSISIYHTYTCVWPNIALRWIYSFLPACQAYYLSLKAVLRYVMLYFMFVCKVGWFSTPT